MRLRPASGMAARDGSPASRHHLTLVDRVNVRDAVVADVADIVRIFDQSIGTFANAVQQPDDPAARRAEIDQGLTTLVAECAGRVVGWGSLRPWSFRPTWPRTVEWAVYVDRANQRSGVGYHLAACLGKRAMELDLRWMYCIVLSENRASIAAMNLLGFPRACTLPNWASVDGAPADVVWHERDVDRGMTDDEWCLFRMLTEEAGFG